MRNFEPFWSLRRGRETVICPPKDKGFRDIGHSMGMIYKGIYYWESTVVTVSYLFRYGSLLQYAIAMLLQNVTNVY